MVSTRIGTADGSQLGNFGLNQDWKGDRAHWETLCLDQGWNGGPTTTGKLWSQPGLKWRLGGIIRVFNFLTDPQYSIIVF